MGEDLTRRRYWYISEIYPTEYGDEKWMKFSDGFVQMSPGYLPYDEAELAECIPDLTLEVFDVIEIDFSERYSDWLSDVPSSKSELSNEELIVNHVKHLTTDDLFQDYIAQIPDPKLSDLSPWVTLDALPIEFFNHEFSDLNPYDKKELLDFMRMWGLIRFPIRSFSKERAEMLPERLREAVKYSDKVQTELVRREFPGLYVSWAEVIEIVVELKAAIAAWLKFSLIRDPKIAYDDGYKIRNPDDEPDMTLINSCLTSDRTLDYLTQSDRLERSRPLTETLCHESGNLISAICNQLLEWTLDEAEPRCCEAEHHDKKGNLTGTCSRIFKRQRNYGKLKHGIFTGEYRPGSTSHYCSDTCSNRQMQWKKTHPIDHGI